MDVWNKFNELDKEDRQILINHFKSSSQNKVPGLIVVREIVKNENQWDAILSSYREGL